MNNFLAWAIQSSRVLGGHRVALPVGVGFDQWDMSGFVELSIDEIQTMHPDDLEAAARFFVDQNREARRTGVSLRSRQRQQGRHQSRCSYDRLVPVVGELLRRRMATPPGLEQVQRSPHWAPVAVFWGVQALILGALGATVSSSFVDLVDNPPGELSRSAAVAVMVITGVLVLLCVWAAVWLMSRSVLFPMYRDLSPIAGDDPSRIRPYGWDAPWGEEARRKQRNEGSNHDVGDDR